LLEIFSAAHGGEKRSARTSVRAKEWLTPFFHDGSAAHGGKI